LTHTSRRPSCSPLRHQALARLAAAEVRLRDQRAPAAPGDRLGGGHRLRDPEQDEQAVAPQLIDHGKVTRSGRAYLGVEVASQLARRAS
jgi:hypothetical protein